MFDETNQNELFHVYYKHWISVYKEGAIRKVTMSKYLMTYQWLVKLIPNLKVNELTRITYQQLLNDYAQEHERQTTMDFHHQLKGAVLDAVDEGLIQRDPTRKAIIKGKTPRVKKPKYLNQLGQDAKVVVPAYNNKFVQENEYEVVHEGQLKLGFFLFSY